MVEKLFLVKKMYMEKDDKSCKENTSTGSIIQKGITQKLLEFHIIIGHPLQRERL